MPPKGDYSGRCYCGASTVKASAAPLTIAYCHCTDCKRISGAPVSCFAAFASEAVTLTTSATPATINAGVSRWFCPQCGSPLAAVYDYLPNQTYLPIGILDQAADLQPEQHSHASNTLPWCQIADDLPRIAQSGRARLNSRR